MGIVSIAIGVLVSYWVDYGTNYIGGTRCAPSIPYTGGSKSSPVFDPYRDIPPTSGCTGQSEVSWRLPLALQIVPGLILGIGMVFFPETPRWLLMKERDDESLTALAKLRRQPQGSNSLIKEYLEIRASIQLENSFAKDNFPGVSGYRLHAAEVHISEITHTLTVLLTYGQYISLLTKWPRFKRLTIGCIVMFFQQFMGCNGTFISSQLCHSFPTCCPSFEIAKIASHDLLRTYYFLSVRSKRKHKLTPCYWNIRNNNMRMHPPCTLFH